MKYLHNYASEEEYIKHQKAKTTCPKRRAIWQKRFEGRTQKFIANFKGINLPSEPNILCLGGRIGCEVEAFHRLGYTKCIAIDLVPCPPLVIEGNFHNIPFKDESFNVIYTNSADHSNDINKMFSEIKRVLVNDGMFILDVTFGCDSTFEVVHWENKEDVIEVASAAGFKNISVNRLTGKAIMLPKGHEYQFIFRNEKFWSL